MLKMLPSDPGFQTVNELWNMYAAAVNPHMLFHIKDDEEDLSADMERWEFVEVQTVLRAWMEALLDGLYAPYLEARVRGGYIFPEENDGRV